MLPSQIIQQQRSVVLAIMERYPMLTNLRVFGSVARGEDTEKSDIDFLVDDLPGTSLFNLSGFQMELELSLGLSIHLLTPSELHPEFRDKSLLEARPV